MAYQLSSALTESSSPANRSTDSWRIRLVVFPNRAGMPDVKERLMKGDTFAARNTALIPTATTCSTISAARTKESPRNGASGT